jgi:hypothetical protein
MIIAGDSYFSIIAFAFFASAIAPNIPDRPYKPGGRIYSSIFFVIVGD